jgi:hypothetical protein
VKPILRYLKGTHTMQLKLGICKGGEGVFELHAGADFAGDPNNLKSTSGTVILDRNGTVFGWCSAKPLFKARSSTVAEYTAVAMAVDAELWLSKVEAEIYADAPAKSATTITRRFRSSSPTCTWRAIATSVSSSVGYTRCGLRGRLSSPTVEALN